jgi:hypothetical protein
MLEHNGFFITLPDRILLINFAGLSGGHSMPVYLMTGAALDRPVGTVRIQ